MKKNFFVFDVESTSLHGKVFAVGAIVMDYQGKEIDHFSLVSCESLMKINDWVKENVLPKLDNFNMCLNDFSLRQRFFDFYMKHKETSEIWADCCFPVETNFLSDIVKDFPIEREFLMSYPLMDISTIIDINFDRFEKMDLNFYSKHNPLHDSIASAKCLISQLFDKQ